MLSQIYKKVNPKTYAQNLRSNLSQNLQQITKMLYYYK